MAGLGLELHRTGRAYMARDVPDQTIPRLAKEPTRLETDVLVVGGGVAGCLAAYEARQHGVDVLVVDKAKMLERAGSVGGGVDQYLAALGTGPDWDDPRYMLWHLPAMTDDLVDMELAERVVLQMPDVMRKVEGFGVDFTDEHIQDYLRTRAFGFPAPYHFNFDGTQFKYHIARAAKKAGTRVLGRTMITDLLTDPDGQRVIGAVGFNSRTSEWYVIRARAVIMSTGDINRISRNLSGNPFDSWHYPYNTGDGHAAAYRAGVPLVNMEFIEATLTPKGFSVQGTNSYVGLGGHFVNGKGERFMFRYDERGEKAPRSTLVDGIFHEIIAGNEPIQIDLRHLDDETLDHFERTLQFDRYTLPGFFRQKGINLRTDLIEVGLSEFSIRSGGSYMRGSGLMVDVNGATPLAGLYAAGDCSLVHGGIGPATVTGVITGEESARWLQSLPDTQDPDPDPERLEAIRTDLEEPIHRHEAGTGVDWRSFEDRLRDTVTRYAGYLRSEASLTRAIEIISEMREQDEGRLAADDLHNLMRAHESRNIIACVDIMARCGLERRDSRSGGHHRVDHPQPDERYTGNFVARQGPDGNLRIDLEPVRPYPLPATVEEYLA